MKRKILIGLLNLGWNFVNIQSDVVDLQGQTDEKTFGKFPRFNKSGSIAE